jgi:hypothetical protein
VLTTSGTYPWSFVTQIFHNGQPSHGGDRTIFEVMTSILPKETLGSVASLLAATLCESWLRTKLYDKRDDFNFQIVNFPFRCSNIPAAPVYGVYISQMI